MSPRRIDGLPEPLDALNAGEAIAAASPHHAAMHATSQAAPQVCARLDGEHHDAAGVRDLLGALTGRPVPDTPTLFPPFTADFGRDIRCGENAFVDSGCRFQDQGGITIGDRYLIGHSAVVTTLDHDLSVARRADLHPAPVVIGDDVRLGANVTILPGVTVGDGAVLGAGAGATRDVAPRAVVVGVPARVVRQAPRA